MRQVTLQFDPPDFVSWLWLAVLVLALVELVRFSLRGRRPAQRRARVLLACGTGALAAGLWMFGLLRPGAWSHVWACVGLGVFASLWLVRTYQRAEGRWRRWMLPGLRVAAAAVLVVAMARPVLQSSQVTHERAVVGVVLDDSRSMTIRDVAGTSADDSPSSQSHSLSRMEAMVRVLDEHRAALSRLADSVELRWFTFDSHVREHPSATTTGTGSQTAVADAVVEVQRLLSVSGQRVAGVVMVSDGRDNASWQSDPSEAGQALLAAGVPFYGVGVGTEQPSAEAAALQARRLDVPARVSAGNRLPVLVELAAAGLAGATIEVELLYDDEVVDRQEAQAGQPEELLRVNLGHVPAEAGLHRVTVEARVAGKDDVEPASVSQIVNVSDDQFHVLYIDRPRYERAAIARALESAKELRVTRMDPSTPGGAGRMRGINWRDYNVVLIGDVEVTDFSEADLQALRDVVTVGGQGLAMLGGMRTLGSGKYRRTALREVLPVDLSAVGHWPGPLDLELTAAGRVHPVLQVGGSGPGDVAAWKTLPPLAGASRLGQVAPAAEVLMQTPGGEPLLVVQELGQGRAAAVAFDSSWQWAFAEPAGLETQRRFWRQLVLWLGDRRPRLWVTADRPRYELGSLLAETERVVLRAGAGDALGRERRDLALRGSVLGPSGVQTPVQWVRTEEGLEAVFTPREEGEYLVRVTVPDTKPEVEAEAAFVVESVDLELVNTAADLESLRTMADRTTPLGGAYFPLDEFGRLLDELRGVGHQNAHTTIQRARLVEDHPWAWFALFLGLLTVEWVLRRRANLV